MWDGTTSTVLIRETGDFEKVRDIFAKSRAAMDGIDKYKISMDINDNSIMDGTSYSRKVGADILCDLANKKMQINTVMNYFGMDFSTDLYYADNASYYRSFLSTDWEKQVYTPDVYDKAFEEIKNTFVPGDSEILYAGLTATDGADGDMTLKGDVFYKEFFDNTAHDSFNSISSQGSTSTMDLNKFYLEMTFEKDTYLTKSIKMNVEGIEHVNKDADASFNMVITLTVSDLNGSFEVTVPQEVLDSAEMVSDDESEE